MKFKSLHLHYVIKQKKAKKSMFRMKEMWLRKVICVKRDVILKIKQLLFGKCIMALYMLTLGKRELDEGDVGTLCTIFETFV